MANTGLIFLNFVKSLTPKKIIDIANYLKEPDRILEIKRGELENISSLDKKNIDEILDLRGGDLLEKELKLLKQKNIATIDIFDKQYPSLLKEISSPPPVLYVKGNCSVLNKFLFAIVGTRIPSFYGLSMAEEFSSKLSTLGIVIISGMARGIDTAVHKGALIGGETAAVLGSGLLNIYPKENSKLSENIANKGAVISEYPLLEPPTRDNFPRRNRIISGLSRGILVIEAAEKSGALITARFACEQNREVFALPGNIDSPLSRGTHILIKEGAKLVDSVTDILEEFNITIEENKNDKKNLSISLSPQEKQVFDFIEKNGIFLEELIHKSNIEQSILNKIILILQFKGLIKEIRPSCYVRI